jgi:hypothetical protein
LVDGVKLADLSAPLIAIWTYRNNGISFTVVIPRNSDKKAIFWFAASAFYSTRLILDTSEAANRA